MRSGFVRASELYDVDSRTPIAHPAHQATDADVRRALEDREGRDDGEQLPAETVQASEKKEEAGYRDSDHSWSQFAQTKSAIASPSTVYFLSCSPNPSLQFGHRAIIQQAIRSNLTSISLVPRYFGHPDVGEYSLDLVADPGGGSR